MRWAVESTTLIRGFRVKHRRVFRWKWLAEFVWLARAVFYAMPSAFPTWATIEPIE